MGVAGSTAIATTSSVQSTTNGTLISIDWTQVPVGGVAAVDLDLDILRSDESVARMFAVRSTDSTDCVQSDTVLVRVDTGCGGERSGIRLSSQASMSITPVPVRGVMSVTVHLPQAGMRLELVDMNGIVLQTHVIGSQGAPNSSTTFGVSCSTLSSGLVIARLVSDQGLHHAIPVIIAP